MGWAYEFITLSEEDKLLRRQALDFYAAVAHLSAFVPALVVLLARLLLARGGGGGGGSSRAAGAYEEVPRSPVIKARRMSGPGGVRARWAMLRWWLRDDVCFRGAHWGQRDQWLLGAAWTAWLLLLTVLGTGTDYLHLTKRFGVIALSQMPVQYLLSLKALNPFAWALGSSHEDVNRYHRVLGRIVYALVLVHLLLYNYFFLAKGVWVRRMSQLVVLCGTLSALAMHVLNGTSMASVRAASYRIFFVTHLVVALGMPPLLFFHAPPARIYVVETLAVFVLDLIVRKASTITAPTTLEAIPGTSLVKATVSIPSVKANQFRVHPGSHIYLSVPASARPPSYQPSREPVFEFLYNPFTVAAVSEDNSDITLVTRIRNGPLTKYLAYFAATGEKVHLGVDGPYGAIGKHYHDLVDSRINRFLIFAGGVGATFALPIYQAILHDNPSAKAQLVWAIRAAGDATWAVGPDSTSRSILADNNIELFVTGDMGVADQDDNAATATTADAGVELSPLYRDTRRGRFTTEHNRKRPDIEKIVDATFRQGTEEAVAVLVCGPTEMAREVRRRVRPWVMRGRQVWWHNESFGW
ncbi:hypothetical protein S40288_02175 [Stachybotrys chartarum IBT 40288]|nr:hypothetical protein S40288_02175 [Stachybotrys chartarum IBT 40288]